MLRRLAQKRTPTSAARTVSPVAEARPQAPRDHGVGPPAPPVRFAPAADLLGHGAVLEHRATYPVLGIRVEVRTNSPAVLAAAGRSFGGWHALAPDFVEPVGPLTVDVIVHAGRPWEIRPTAFVYRAHGDCFLAAAESNVMTAQLDQGRALAFATPELVASDLVFRRTVLECLALLLVGRHDRTPLHAAAVVRNGRTVVLAGPSGSGKSTLAYACLKAGFQLLGEDVVYVSVRDGLRLWGIPWQLHLLSDAPRIFPELADVPTELQPSGKLKLPVDVTKLGTDRAVFYGARPAVCLLQRHRRSASLLERVTPQTVVDAFSQAREPGFDLYPQAAALAGRLAEEGAYRLTLGTDVTGAVKRLQALTDAESGRPE